MIRLLILLILSMTLVGQDAKKKVSLDPFCEQSIKIDSLNNKIDRTNVKWDSIAILMKKKYPKKR